jgi:branched-chain amino acid transport system substrate-binding protein
MGKIKNWGPERYGLEVSAVINTLTSLESFKVAPGMEGGAFYYYELPKNPINDWLVAAMKKRYNAPPDYFTVEGFTAAIVAITGIEKAKSTQPEAVIKAMEGMEFDSPRGKMTFRAEDHQAMMPMYDIRLKNVDGLNRAVPELVREISASEFKIPIRNKR